MVATSATRDAANRDDFFAMTREVLGAVIAGAEAEVISGDEEARLSFTGAVGELDPARGPFVVVDLGGGSTEVVLGDADGVHAAYSTDIGCVRLTERCLHDDPPTAEQVAAARTFAGEKITEALAHVPVEQARTWVGVAGTMTTIAALANGLEEYDPERVHLSTVGFDRLRQVCDGLLAATHDERAALGPMHPGRVDVIGGRSRRHDRAGRRTRASRGDRRAGRERARHPRRDRTVDRVGSRGPQPLRAQPYALTIVSADDWARRGCGPRGATLYSLHAPP